MKKVITIMIPVLITVLFFVQCKGPAIVTTTPVAPTLTKVWETPAQLETNESVLVDPATGTIYVSNIEGRDPVGKDGKGSIAIINKDGSILNASWISGLNAPKGMGITNGKLYVTDIDELVEIDIASSRVVQKYPVNNSVFLNDVATHGGKVYFSDMRTGTVHMFQDGQLSVVSTGNNSINGLATGTDGTLYGLDASGLKKWNADGSSTIINNQVKGGDGLIVLGDGKFIASKWQGEIWFVQNDTQILLLDTKAEEFNTADIGYLPDERLVLVPTFFKNRVTAYKLQY